MRLWKLKYLLVCRMVSHSVILVWVTTPTAQHPEVTYWSESTILDSDGYTRKGNDLWTDRSITAFEAMRGCEFTIQDLSDTTVKVRVPAGTQPNSVLQLKDKGMPVHENLSIRGNMYIRIHITIPKLNEEQLKKIKDL
jgi:curved DNA-binding protein